MSASRPLGLAIVLLAQTGCASPYAIPSEAQHGGDTTSNGDGDSDTRPADAESDASDEDGPKAECEVDADCFAALPYCDGLHCVDCTAIGHSGCHARDPDAPLCDPTKGWCVQCTPDLALACSGQTPICDPSGQCAGCGSADECVNFCDLPSGYCDAAPLRAQPFHWELVSEPVMQVDAFSIETSSFFLTLVPDSTGIASFPPVDWSESIRYEWRRNQLRPINLSGSTTKMTWDARFPASSADPVRVPYLSKATAGRIAYECGLFESLDAATGELTGTIPSQVHSRGILLVELADGASSPEPVDRTQISVQVDDWMMSHGSQDPDALQDAFICDITSEQGLRLGNPASNQVGTEGWFVVFGLRSASGSPLGAGSISVPGYDPAEFSLGSWGAMAYLRLRPS